jgi:NhaP-type Na+/H+ or K+/H+ antiporter
MLERIHRLAQWMFLGAVVGVACGIASALFLWLLSLATAFRTSHEAIVFAIPVAGFVMGLVLQKWGGPIGAGNNLVSAARPRGSGRCSALLSAARCSP